MAVKAKKQSVDGTAKGDQGKAKVLEGTATSAPTTTPNPAVTTTTPASTTAAPTANKSVATKTNGNSAVGTTTTGVQSHQSQQIIQQQQQQPPQVYPQQLHSNAPQASATSTSSSATNKANCEVRDFENLKLKLGLLTNLPGGKIDTPKVESKPRIEVLSASTPIQPPAPQQHKQSQQKQLQQKQTQQQVSRQESNDVSLLGNAQQEQQQQQQAPVQQEGTVAKAPKKEPKGQQQASKEQGNRAANSQQVTQQKTTENQNYTSSQQQQQQHPQQQHPQQQQHFQQQQHSQQQQQQQQPQQHQQGHQHKQQKTKHSSKADVAFDSSDELRNADASRELEAPTRVYTDDPVRSYTEYMQHPNGSAFKSFNTLRTEPYDIKALIKSEASLSSLISQPPQHQTSPNILSYLQQLQNLQCPVSNQFALYQQLINPYYNFSAPPNPPSFLSSFGNPQSNCLDSNNLLLYQQLSTLLQLNNNPPSQQPQDSFNWLLASDLTTAPGLDFADISKNPFNQSLFPSHRVAEGNSIGQHVVDEASQTGSPNKTSDRPSIEIRNLEQQLLEKVPSSNKKATQYFADVSSSHFSLPNHVLRPKASINGATGAQQTFPPTPSNPLATFTSGSCSSSDNNSFSFKTSPSVKADSHSLGKKKRFVVSTVKNDPIKSALDDSLNTTLSSSDSRLHDAQAHKVDNKKSVSESPKIDHPESQRYSGSVQSAVSRSVSTKNIRRLFCCNLP